MEGNVTVTAGGRLLMPVAGAAEVPVCRGDTIQTGPKSRAAIHLEKTGQTIRLDEGTEVRVLPEAGRPLLYLEQGLLYLISPGGEPLNVRTPFVTAGTEGTEFFVRSAKNLVAVGVTEGEVRVRHRSGTDDLLLTAGEATVATPDKAPTLKIKINPRDQVRWAIYYPPVLWEQPPGARLEPQVEEAWRAWRARNTSRAIALIKDLKPALLDPVSRDYVAAILVSVGRTDEVGGTLGCPDFPSGLDGKVGVDGTLSLPATARSHALCSIIAVARNDPGRALDEAGFAVALDPTDASARIAQSYALQADLRLEEARSVLVELNRPNDSLVQARLAEIELYLGRVDAARAAAQVAVSVGPGLSRPYSIIGFAELAKHSIPSAIEAFHSAVFRDPADPLPRIGLGLTSIRTGALAAGRAELESAVALDPQGSVFRSYLGKAYAAERNYKAARREWLLAQKIDPRDPTPFLYRSLVERTLNRPVEALGDIQQSIERNDNRAIYRSRLLLDQDLAIRTADLASIYRDLGFDQAALAEAYRSVNLDPANPAAHRFLAETLLVLPRHESASDSELLQSLLLQPLDISPPRPRLSREGLGINELFAPTRVGYNEFSPLFAADGLGLLLSSR